jgi:hypothetical protein
MAIKPIADAEGWVRIDDDLVFESLGDPALDRILLKCHNLDLQLRQLAEITDRLQSTFTRMAWVFGTLVVITVGAWLGR